MSDLEDVLRRIHTNTQRQRRNPARHAAVGQSAYEEIPLALSVSAVDEVGTPLWGDILTDDEVVDHFTELGDADVALDSHTADTGDSWTQVAGSMIVGTVGDYAYEVGSVDALYKVGRASGDMRVTVVVNTPGTAGIAFRIQDEDNYWKWYQAGINQIYLDHIENGVGTQKDSYTQTVYAGDLLGVEAIGSHIVCWLNGAGDREVIYESGSLNTMGSCGVWMGSLSFARYDEFHAWDIVGTVLDQGTDPGHIYWGGPETYPYLRDEDSVSRSVTVVRDWFVNWGDEDELLETHVADTGHRWAKVGGAEGTAIVSTGHKCESGNNSNGIFYGIDTGGVDGRVAMNAYDAWEKGGLAFRMEPDPSGTPSSFWKMYQPQGGSNEYQLDEIIDDIATMKLGNMGVPEFGDQLMVEFIGSTVKCFVDGELKGVVAAGSVNSPAGTIHGITAGGGNFKLISGYLWDIE